MSGAVEVVMAEEVPIVMMAVMTMMMVTMMAMATVVTRPCRYGEDSQQQQSERDRSEDSVSHILGRQLQLLKYSTGF